MVMAAQKLVLIDTCIWVQFFNRPHSDDKKAVDLLLDDDRAALVGPILTEVLVGFRRHEQADWVASLLRGLRFLQVTWDEWRAAARLGRELIANGHTVPQSDLVIAAVGLERDIAVYTTDPHFDLVPHLKKHGP
jgi:predicted nucleic acid-binding protein